ncbi:MAG: helix-turn-helix transcriptional regulator [Thermacetogeniaceae bacterium]|jgi:transcriptional regulator with XRE-family HTH domain
MMPLSGVTYTVKQARVLKDITQEQMAIKMGVSTATYRKLEENPDIITIRQARIIARETGQPFDAIFFA